MHKIAAKEFTLEDFSIEHLFDETGPDGDNCDYWWLSNFSDTVIRGLNTARQKYLETLNKPMKEEGKRSALAKKYWWQMIQLLPTSYNQKRTVMLNYEVLTGIYESRKNHKLDEWREFCKWIESLPYSEIIIGEDLEVKTPEKFPNVWEEHDVSGLLEE